MTASLPDSYTLPATVLVTELHHSMGHYSDNLTPPRAKDPDYTYTSRLLPPSASPDLLGVHIPALPSSVPPG